MSLPQPLEQSSSPRSPSRTAVRLVGATLAAMCALTGTALAKGPTFALQPMSKGAYYTFDAARGKTVTGRIRVFNTGTSAGVVHLYAVDATTGPTSGAAYLTEPGRATDVGAWTRLSTTTVSLRPGKSKVVAFQVRVPDDARTGDHLGGITADPGAKKGDTVNRKGSSFRIDVRTLTVIAVKTTVPGPRPAALDVDGVKGGGLHSYQQLFLHLRNSGNVLLKGSGSVSVSGDGRAAKHAKFTLDTFVPRTQIDYPVFVPGKALAAGHYSATVTLHYPGRTVTRTFGFKIGAKELEQVYGSHPPAAVASPRSLPVLSLIVGGIVLLILGFVTAALIFRRREAKRVARSRERDLHDLALWEPRVEPDREAATRAGLNELPPPPDYTSP